MAPKTGEYTNEARDFITFNRHGILSTISKKENGYPFGSIVSYDISEKGEILIFISLIAEHYKNLVSDPRASLCISDPYGVDDPQSHARATILTQFTPAPEAERSEIQKRYEARFPDAINYEIAHNFVFMKGAPERIRWIGGFGEIGWVDGAEFSSTAPDLLAYNGYSVIKHMNEDHHDALCDFVRGYSSFDPTQFHVEMVKLHAGGFSINLTKEDQRHPLEIQFPKIITSEQEVRGVIVSLLKEVRQKLSN